MPKEVIPLQHDMFTGEFVDTRSGYRKRQDKLRTEPQQLWMFSANELVHLSANVRPWLNQLPATPLELISEDPRTPEEREQDLVREAQKQTCQLFPKVDVENTLKTPILTVVAPAIIETLPRIKRLGFRQRQRQTQVLLRSRALSVT